MFFNFLTSTKSAFLTFAVKWLIKISLNFIQRPCIPEIGKLSPDLRSMQTTWIIQINLIDGLMSGFI